MSKVDKVEEPPTEGSEAEEPDLRVASAVLDIGQEDLTEVETTHLRLRPRCLRLL
jgi:hypothetical protein